LVDGSSNHNNIIGNTFTDGGLLISFSYGNIVEGNVVNGKPVVFLEDVSDCTVSDGGQVILVNCSNIRVENLNLSNTVVGLELWKTDNSKIADNNITNSYYGIWLSDSSNNSIVRNNITYNNYGIQLWWSSNNRLYHNNFIDNSNQVFDLAWDDPEIPRSTNFWDDGYPSGGNYWSDYNGTDLFSGSFQNITGTDGIGDIQYVVDDNNTDRYPLMKPWIPGFLETDLNNDGKVDMKDVALVAYAFGSNPDHPRWNPVADINGDNKVDMKDIGTVAKDFGKTI